MKKKVFTENIQLHLRKVWLIQTLKTSGYLQLETVYENKNVDDSISTLQIECKTITSHNITT